MKENETTKKFNVIRILLVEIAQLNSISTRNKSIYVYVT